MFGQRGKNGCFFCSYRPVEMDAERLNFYEEKYACHITKVLPSGIIEYEFNPSCANYYRTVKDEEEK